MAARLEILTGLRQGEVYPLFDGSRMTIGRAHDSDLQLLDEGVSRAHCMIQQGPGGFMVSDQASRNGTFVNGRRVDRALLRDGDALSVGSASMRFVARALRPDEEETTVRLIDDAIPAPTTLVSKPSQRGPIPFADSTTIEQTLEAYKALHNDLAVIYRISELTNLEASLPALLDAVMDAVLEVIPADRGVLFVVDPDTRALKPRAMRSSGDDLKDTRISRTIVAEAVERGMSTLAADAMHDERFSKGESVKLGHIRSVLCVPLRGKQAVLGALYLDTTSAVHAFNERTLDLLTAIGQQAGLAIQRARLSDELQRLFIQLIRTLVAAIEINDMYTYGHSERVTNLSLAIAEQMGLPVERRELIELGGLLHDIGKIGISEQILNKTEPFTPAEWEVVKSHPELGEHILSRIGNERINKVIPLVRHHHEHWDGSGYPDALQGENIPLEARIVAVADAFDAMTSNRPYARDIAPGQVFQELQRCAGTQFDRQVVSAFIARCCQADMDLPSAIAPLSKEREKALRLFNQEE